MSNRDCLAVDPSVGTQQPSLRPGLFKSVEVARQRNISEHEGG